MRAHAGLIVLLMAAGALASPSFFNRRGGSSYFGGVPGGRPNTDEYYNLLGVPKTSTEAEIRRAYRRLAVKMHPDKGGDEAKFKELSTAYEVLSNPEKRRVYDMYGKAGLEGGAGRGFDPEQDLFGGAGPFFNFFQNQRRYPRQAANVMVNAEVTLEELFNGTTRTMKLQKRKVVDKRLVVEVKPLEILIPRGARAGTRVVLPGEVDDPMGGAPGDVIVNVVEMRHPRFTRSNADLLVEMRVTLTEALTGFEKGIKHLDGKTVWIKSRPGQVTAPGSIWVLEGKGMPVYKDPTRRGRLFVRIAVEFPATLTLSPEQLEQLRKLLPKSPSGPKRPSDDVPIDLKRADPRTFGQSGSQFVEDTDDESGGEWTMGPGVENVQCSQQ